MRSWGMFGFFVAALFYAINFHPSLSQTSQLSDANLESELRQLSVALDMHQRQNTIPEGGLLRLAEMKSRHGWLNVESWIRKFYADQWMPVLMIFGITLFISPSIRRRERKPKKKKVDAREALRIREVSPREEYVDEVEYQGKIEGGFAKREDAANWLLSDPMLKCDYCGGDLRSLLTGEQEALQLVTFYKRVPEGAKDLRVVLGSVWFVKSATELQCSSCERIVRR